MTINDVKPTDITSLDQLLQMAKAWQQHARDRYTGLQAEIDSGRLRSYQNFSAAKDEVDFLRVEVQIYGKLIEVLGGEDPMNYSDEDDS